MSDILPTLEHQDELVNMLLSCKTATLKSLQTLANASNPTTTVFANPSLAQIVLARALSVGNRSFAIEIMHNTRPAPTHDLVFSPEGDQLDHVVEESCNGRESFRARMFVGQQDSGCDIWHTMITTGWASAREYMHLYIVAGGDDNDEAPRKLYETLIQRGAHPDSRKVGLAVAFGCLPTVQLYLDQHISDYGPLSRRKIHEYYSIAAVRDDVALLELLFNRLDSGVLDDSAPEQSTRDLVAQRSPNEPGPLQSILHEAAEQGSTRVVTWLLDHGAGRDNPRNLHGQTAFELAGAWREYLAERLHHNPNHPARYQGLQDVMELLDARGLGPAEIA